MTRVEAELLYDVLEREVVPLFFAREGVDRLPRGWIKRMKSSIAKLVPEFNTARMVREYAKRFYVPAIKVTQRLADGDLEEAKALCAWKDRVRATWPAVAVREVRLDSNDEVPVGEPVRVSAIVDLGTLTPGDVSVELYYGPTSGGHEVVRGVIVPMPAVEKGTNGTWRFSGEIPTKDSGAHAFAVRVLPYNEAMSNPHETSLIRWA